MFPFCYESEKTPGTFLLPPKKVCVPFSSIFFRKLLPLSVTMHFSPLISGPDEGVYKFCVCLIGGKKERVCE